MNELTAKDLMVGDWVLYNPNVFIEDEYELPKDSYPTKISCGEDIDLAFEDCYSPIPLTAEILEKNFPTIEDGVTWSETADSNLFNIRVEYDKYVEGIFKYVHELHHALQLCGIDKEIKL